MRALQSSWRGARTAWVAADWEWRKEVVSRWWGTPRFFSGDCPTRPSAARVGAAARCFWRELVGASARGEPGKGGVTRIGPLAPPIPPLPTRAGSGVLWVRGDSKRRGEEGGGARGRSVGHALIGRGRPAAFPRLGQGHAHPGSGAESNAPPGLDRVADSDFKFQVLRPCIPTVLVLVWGLQESWPLKNIKGCRIFHEKILHKAATIVT